MARVKVTVRKVPIAEIVAVQLLAMRDEAVAAQHLVALKTKPMRLLRKSRK